MRKVDVPQRCAASNRSKPGVGQGRLPGHKLRERGKRREPLCGSVIKTAALKHEFLKAYNSCEHIPLVK